MALKDTLLMPKTSFEMRGNLSQKEPNLVKKWHEDLHLYEMMLGRNLKNLSFILHDGPPYANGNIHCGHMLNRILKDFVIRFKNMQGYQTPFTFGWDTHGLPIENNVTKSGVNRKTTPIVEFRQKCREYALKQVANQKEQIKRLGIIGDYNDPYLTLNKEFEVSQIEVFKNMALRGLIYKGLKPVYWSYSSESALAEAEIEYKDVTSYAIFVAFDVCDGKGVLENGDKIVIWTTTPWTLPANLAICLNEDFTYGLYETNKGRLVFLNSFKDKFVEQFGLEYCNLVKEIKGKDLEYVEANHPFIDRKSIVILGDHVTDDAGTGCVHTAPGHGADDFNVGTKYGLPLFCPVDYKGFMMDEAGEDLKGLFYEDANKKVIEILKEKDALLRLDEINHSYPHDWRTGKPVIFRATPQWFCSIEPIREQILADIEKIKWHPSWGKVRMHNMIKDRADWCISRQRVWGVPLPIIYNEDGSPIIEEAVFDHIIELFKVHGSDCWYSLSEKELLPEGYTNPASPNGEFKKETDIMDVWFDSGSSFNGVIKNRGHKYPCDLYLEGSDQYRGWFNSSLIISEACYNLPPYKEVCSHGFVMDAKWEKMSKSKGNGIDPIKVTNVYGADILRFWTASVDYQQDVRISEDLIKQVAEGYRKIRNTFKFLLGNLSNGADSHFELTDRQFEFEAIDTYILARLEQVKNKFINYFETYNFQLALQEVLTFISTDLSSFYLDFAKDILYCNSKKSKRRLQIQTVIFDCYDTLMRLLNPIIPFTMDEALNAFNVYCVENVQMLDFPKTSHDYDEKVLDEYKWILKLRADVLKAIEIVRRNNEIGSAQQARVVIEVNDENHYLDKYYADEFAKLFIVSDAKVVKSLEDVTYEGEVAKVKVIKAEGTKCDRCWNIVDHTYETEEGEHVCERCHEVIHE